MQREKVLKEMRLELFTDEPITTTEAITTTATTLMTKMTRPKWTWPPGLENSKLFGLFDEIKKPNPSKMPETLTTTENPI